MPDMRLLLVIVCLVANLSTGQASKLPVRDRQVLNDAETIQGFITMGCQDAENPSQSTLPIAPGKMFALLPSAGQITLTEEGGSSSQIRIPAGSVYGITATESGGQVDRLSGGLCTSPSSTISLPAKSVVAIYHVRQGILRLVEEVAVTKAPASITVPSKSLIGQVQTDAENKWLGIGEAVYSTQHLISADPAATASEPQNRPFGMIQVGGSSVASITLTAASTPKANDNGDLVGILPIGTKPASNGAVIDIDVPSGISLGVIPHQGSGAVTVTDRGTSRNIDVQPGTMLVAIPIGGSGKVTSVVHQVLTRKDSVVTLPAGSIIGVIQIKVGGIVKSFDRKLITEGEAVVTAPVDSIVGIIQTTPEFHYISGIGGATFGTKLITTNPGSSFQSSVTDFVGFVNLAEGHSGANVASIPLPSDNLVDISRVEKPHEANTDLVIPSGGSIFGIIPSGESVITFQEEGSDNPTTLTVPTGAQFGVITGGSEGIVTDIANGFLTTKSSVMTFPPQSSLVLFITGLNRRIIHEQILMVTKEAIRITAPIGSTVGTVSIQGNIVSCICSALVTLPASQPTPVPPSIASTERPIIAPDAKPPVPIDTSDHSAPQPTTSPEGSPTASTASPTDAIIFPEEPALGPVSQPQPVDTVQIVPSSPSENPETQVPQKPPTAAVVVPEEPVPVDIPVVAPAPESPDSQGVPQSTSNDTIIFPEEPEEPILLPNPQQPPVDIALVVPVDQPEDGKPETVPQQPPTDVEVSPIDVPDEPVSGSIPQQPPVEIAVVVPIDQPEEGKPDSTPQHRPTDTVIPAIEVPEEPVSGPIPQQPPVEIAVVVPVDLPEESNPDRGDLAEQIPLEPIPQSPPKEIEVIIEVPAEAPTVPAIPQSPSVEGPVEPSEVLPGPQPPQTDAMVVPIDVPAESPSVEIPLQPTEPAEVRPVPIPGPLPIPIDLPEPFPDSGPEPFPHPGPEPFPHPGLFPDSGPGPFPHPGPFPDSGPEPFPHPGPFPDSGPGPFPHPGPFPDSGPGPFPLPVPFPGPNSIPPPEVEVTVTTGHLNPIEPQLALDQQSPVQGITALGCQDTTNTSPSQEPVEANKPFAIIPTTSDQNVAVTTTEGGQTTTNNYQIPPGSILTITTSQAGGTASNLNNGVCTTNSTSIGLPPKSTISTYKVVKGGRIVFNKKIAVTTSEATVSVPADSIVGTLQTDSDGQIISVGQANYTTLHLMSTDVAEPQSPTVPRPFGVLQVSDSPTSGITVTTATTSIASENGGLVGILSVGQRPDRDPEAATADMTIPTGTTLGAIPDQSNGTVSVVDQGASTNTTLDILPGTIMVAIPTGGDGQVTSVVNQLFTSPTSTVTLPAGSIIGFIRVTVGGIIIQFERRIVCTGPTVIYLPNRCIVGLIQTATGTQKITGIGSAPFDTKLITSVLTSVPQSSTTGYIGYVNLKGDSSAILGTTTMTIPTSPPNVLSVVPSEEQAKAPNKDIVIPADESVLGILPSGPEEQMTVVEQEDDGTTHNTTLTVPQGSLLGIQSNDSQGSVTAISGGVFSTSKTTISYQSGCKFVMYSLGTGKRIVHQQVLLVSKYVTKVLVPVGSAVGLLGFGPDAIDTIGGVVLNSSPSLGFLNWTQTIGTNLLNGSVPVPIGNLLLVEVIDLGGIIETETNLTIVTSDALTGVIHMAENDTLKHDDTDEASTENIPVNATAAILPLQGTEIVVSEENGSQLSKTTFFIVSGGLLSIVPSGSQCTLTGIVKGYLTTDKTLITCPTGGTFGIISILSNGTVHHGNSISTKGLTTMNVPLWSTYGLIKTSDQGLVTAIGPASFTTQFITVNSSMEQNSQAFLGTFGILQLEKDVNVPQVAFATATPLVNNQGTINGIIQVGKPDSLTGTESDSFEFMTDISVAGDRTIGVIPFRGHGLITVMTNIFAVLPGQMLIILVPTNGQGLVTNIGDDFFTTGSTTMKFEAGTIVGVASIESSGQILGLDTSITIPQTTTFTVPAGSTVGYVVKDPADDTTVTSIGGAPFYTKALSSTADSEESTFLGILDMRVSERKPIVHQPKTDGQHSPQSALGSTDLIGQLVQQQLLHAVPNLKIGEIQFRDNAQDDAPRLTITDKGTSIFDLLGRAKPAAKGLFKKPIASLHITSQ